MAHILAKLDCSVSSYTPPLTASSSLFLLILLAAEVVPGVLHMFPHLVLKLQAEPGHFTRERMHIQRSQC